MKYYKISEKTLKEYLIMAHYFNALEMGGVDNWEWYSYSISDYIKDCSVIDETHYDDIEHIVDTEMATMTLCHCEEQLSAAETIM